MKEAYCVFLRATSKYVCIDDVGYSRPETSTDTHRYIAVLLDFKLQCCHLKATHFVYGFQSNVNTFIQYHHIQFSVIQPSAMQLYSYSTTSTSCFHKIYFVARVCYFPD
jgi:hypothetical protein